MTEENLKDIIDNISKDKKISNKDYIDFIFSNDFKFIRYIVNNYNIKKALEILNKLLILNKNNINTKYYIDILNNVDKLNEYCKKIFDNTKIDSQEILNSDVIKNIFEFNLLYAYAFKNKLIELDSEQLKEIEDIKKIKNGDKELLDKYLDKYKNFIKYFAKKYKKEGIDREDLIQEGTLGFLESINKYDASYNSKFSTFSSFYIRRYMTRFIHTYGRNIKIPEKMQEIYMKIDKIKKEYKSKYDNDISIEEISNILGISVSKLNKIISDTKITNTISLNKIINDDYEELGSIVELEENLSDEVIKRIENQELYALLDETELTNIEKDVLINRFGLYNTNPKKLRELGEKYNMTRESIRLIEKKALNKLIKRVTEKKALIENRTLK